MSDFDLASQEEQIARLEGLGLVALAEFGVVPDSLTSLVHAENTTFRVGSPQGEFCLRISRPGYQSPSNLQSEIAFLAALTEAGFRVPSPYQPRVVTASATGVPESRNCVLFRWLEGEIYKKGLTSAQMAGIGELLARLHDFAETWLLPEGFDRQAVQPWTLNPSLPMAIDVPSDGIDEKDRQFLLGIAAESRAAVATMPHDPKWFGLIHSDLHAANVVFQGDQVCAIDFDDTGFGFLLFDLATAVSNYVGKDTFLPMREALFEGYTRVRPLPPQCIELLPIFLRLRMAALANWVAGRLDNPYFRSISVPYIGRVCEDIRMVSE